MITLLFTSFAVFSADFQGKKIIEIHQPTKTEIELPDHQTKDFGQDYYLRLVSDLIKSDQVVVSGRISEKQIQDTEELVWSGPVVPALEMKVDLQAMSFVTGSRGNRMFYGFDEKNEKIGIRNEFPVKSKATAASYFYHSFDAKGDLETGSLSGLDLGEGFSLDVIFAFLKVKFATYRTRMKLGLQFHAPVTGEWMNRSLDIKGKGYFYDVVGGYLGYYGGLAVARRDAWLKSFQSLVAGSAAEITKVLKSVPLTGVVHGVVNTSQGPRYLIGTGFSSGIKAGVLYSNASRTHVFEVEKSVSSGSICILKSGDPNAVQINMVLTEWDPDTGREIASLSQMQSDGSHQEVSLPDQNIPKTQLGDPALDHEKRPSLWTLIKRLATLPYRIYRYFHYDQKLKSKQSIYQGEPLLAVIDTGLNYNHKKLKNHLWVEKDVSDLRYGWDFVSGDARPYDDHYHGTEVSLAALSQMRGGKIMPLKVFNPWGVTSSDHLVRAMKFAATHGAKVVLTAWKTFVDAEALKVMKRIAEENDIVWITAGEGNDLQAAILAGQAAQMRKDHPQYTALEVEKALKKTN